MALPTTRSVVTTLEPKVLIVYGPPKVGKTSSIAQLESNLILDLEQPPGTSFVSCLSVPIPNYATFKSTCQEVIAGGRKYDFITMDTVDMFERLCKFEAQLRYKGSNMGSTFSGSDILTDLAKGAGYPLMWNVIQEGLDLLCSAAKRIILVGHLKEKLLPDGMAMEDSEGSDLDLTGKVKNIVYARADAIGLLKRKPRPGRKPGEPVISDLYINFKTSDTTNCGCRATHLAGREFLFSSVDDKIAKWTEIYPSLAKK